MAANDLSHRYITYAMHEPSLREQAPDCLRRARPLWHEFEKVNDKQQGLHNNKVFTEDAYQRNQGEDGGSKMVKRQKPFPEMKPENYYDVKKSSFNKAWIQEQRDAQMAYLSNQRESMEQRNQRSEPVFER